jgi:hypothetical protein
MRKISVEYWIVDQEEAQQAAGANWHSLRQPGDQILIGNGGKFTLNHSGEYVLYGYDPIGGT